MNRVSRQLYFEVDGRHRVRLLQCLLLHERRVRYSCIVYIYVNFRLLSVTLFDVVLNKFLLESSYNSDGTGVARGVTPTQWRATTYAQ